LDSKEFDAMEEMFHIQVEDEIFGRGCTGEILATKSKKMSKFHVCKKKKKEQTNHISCPSQNC
jgi:hypothetical protein